MCHNLCWCMGVYTWFHKIHFIWKNIIEMKYSWVLLQCSPILRYFAQHCSGLNITQIRVCFHQRHPISRTNGRDMGCQLWGFLRKLTAFYQHHPVFYTPIFHRCNIHSFWLKFTVLEEPRNRYHCAFCQYFSCTHIVLFCKTRTC